MLRGRVFFTYIYISAQGGQDPGHHRLFPRFPRELWMCKTPALSPFPLKDANASLLATLPTNLILRVNAYMNLQVILSMEKLIVITYVSLPTFSCKKNNSSLLTWWDHAPMRGCHIEVVVSSYEMSFPWSPENLVPSQTLEQTFNISKPAAASTFTGVKAHLLPLGWMSWFPFFI